MGYYKSFATSDLNRQAVTDSTTQRAESGNAVKRVFREVKRRTNRFTNCFSYAEAENL
jgi:hypothetical protein